MDLLDLGIGIKPYYQDKWRSIYCGDCSGLLSEFPDGCVDLTVTSPPYDNLRAYKGYSFPFEDIARQLYRVTKQGGVVVWVEKCSYSHWCDSMVDFEHALIMKALGFSVRTMIYRKIGNQAFNWKTEKFYPNGFEYMFICAKGRPSTVNLLRDVKNKHAGEQKPDYTKKRTRAGIIVPSGRNMTVAQYGLRQTVWDYHIGYMKSSGDKIAYTHPAIFPEALARDHILSWSNKGDLVLDPMCGSGTTPKIAGQENRYSIGIDVSKEYCDISASRCATDAVSRIQKGEY